MTKRGPLAIALIAAMMAATSAQAAPLTLACSGVSTTSDTDQPGSATAPQKETIADLSVVVDPDRRLIFGFLIDQTAIPITGMHPSSITFKGDRKSRVNESTIEGTVGRITGKIDATTISIWGTGRVLMTVLDLRCKPTRPLF